MIVSPLPYSGDFVTYYENGQIIQAAQFCNGYLKELSPMYDVKGQVYFNYTIENTKGDTIETIIRKDSAKILNKIIYENRRMKYGYALNYDYSYTESKYNEFDDWITVTKTFKGNKLIEFNYSPKSFEEIIDKDTIIQLRKNYDGELYYHPLTNQRIHRSNKEIEFICSYDPDKDELIKISTRELGDDRLTIRNYERHVKGN